MATEKWQAALAHVPLHFIHNQSVAHLEGQTCPPSSIATFANGLSARAMPGSSRFGSDFSGGGFFFFRYISSSQHSTRCFLSDSRGTERRQCSFHDTFAFLYQNTISISTNTCVSSISMSSIGPRAAAINFQHTIADQRHVCLVMSCNDVGSTRSMLLTISCVKSNGEN